MNSRHTPDNLDLWLRRWLAYADIMKPLWRFFPELLTAGFTFILPVGIKGQILSYPRRFGSTVKGLMSFLLKTETPRPLNENCDIILVYHQPMTNAMQPMLTLAQSLQEAGADCLVWGPLYHGAVWWKGRDRQVSNMQDQKDEFLKYLNRLMLVGFSRAYALKLLCLAFLETAVLILRILQKRRFELIDICINPFVIWLKLVRSAHRRRAADYILKQMDTKVLVVSYERYPPASEFLLSRQAKEISTMHYHHGFSSIYDIPHLTKEVLVWNQTDAEMLKEICPPGDLPHITIVGNIELDLGLAKQFTGRDKECLKQKLGLAGDEPVLLFLSQYVPALTTTTKFVERALDWLCDVAKHCPSWHIVVKEHNPYDDIRKAMLAHGLLDFKNVTVLPFDKTILSDLLHLDTVKVVAAVSSVGLFITSGFGKVAVRMVVESADIKMPYIDETAYQIYSPQELVKLLKNISEKGLEPSRVNNGAIEKIYPFKGESIERIKQLCLEQLAKTKEKIYLSTP